MSPRTKNKLYQSDRLRSLENFKIKPKDINDDRKMLYGTNGLAKCQKIPWGTCQKPSPKRLSCPYENYVPCRNG